MALVLPPNVKHRLRLSGAHLLASLLVAALIAALVFGLWYPAPFRTLSGGLHLFALLVAVDVALGPLATLVVSRPGKPAREWRMDVALIVLLQLAALGYGLWTLHQARPVYMAFEIDRLRVVSAADVAEELLPQAPANLSQLPQWRPGLVAVRPFASETEKAEATMAALQGVELGFRPDFWVPYEDATAQIRAAALPIADLLAKHPAQAAELSLLMSSHGRDPATVRYLPLHARSAFWTALLDGDSLKPFAYVALDPYEQ